MISHIETVFREHVPGRIDSEKEFRAAVLIPLIDGPKGPEVLFEVRAGSILQGGDISFPGGGMEEGETIARTAVRETCEELCIKAEQIRLIGQSDYFSTGKGRTIYACVGELTGYHGTFSPDEVAEVFTVPLSFFQETEPERYRVSLNEEPEEDFPFDRIVGGRNYRWINGKREILFYNYEGRTIWGITAKLIHAFARILREEETKTAKEKQLEK